jgi:hypothetical protein
MKGGASRASGGARHLAPDVAGQAANGTHATPHRTTTAPEKTATASCPARAKSSGGHAGTTHAGVERGR